ncbi:MAG TPA: hypothetical protein VM327_04455 [Candidatus Thermoplasmatota archaeon]|nr:hypothetical protein [Candidatus Thermoplasmatota archaeon]
MANPLVEFNDSQLGVVLGSVFHTLGAIAFLGGLVGYLSWHRHLIKGEHNRRVLDNAAFLTYLSIVVNLLGGFMRTYQTGHPHVWQFAESPWVRAIVIKHVFLFAAQGAAVYLFEVVAPRLVKAHKVGDLAEPSPLGHRVAVVLVAIGILVAAVLGALTQVVALVSADAPLDGMHDHGGPAVQYHNASGQLTSTAFQPSASTGSFDVANGTVLLEATLLWDPTQYTLRLDLTDPAGKTTPTTGTGGSLDVEIEAPKLGTWTYGITSDLAVNTAWTLSARMPMVAGDEELVAGTRTIPPGRFFEVNTGMENNSAFYWSWSSSATVHFNVHSHFDDQVQDHVDEDAESGRGNFTNHRKGGYSLLWENTGTLPVTLDYRVWGDFTLDSVFPA